MSNRPLAVRVLEILSETGDGTTAGYVFGLSAIGLLVRG